MLTWRYNPGNVPSHLSTRWVLSATHNSWMSWIDPESADEYLRHGHYTVKIRDNFRILVLNTNLCFGFNLYVLVILHLLLVHSSHTKHFQNFTDSWEHQLFRFYFENLGNWKLNNPRIFEFQLAVVQFQWLSWATPMAKIRTAKSCGGPSSCSYSWYNMKHV